VAVRNEQSEGGEGVGRGGEAVVVACMYPQGRYALFVRRICCLFICIKRQSLRDVIEF
jgi:hypothetical protein